VKPVLFFAVILLLVASIAGVVWQRQRAREAASRATSATLQARVEALESELVEKETREPQRSAEVPVQTPPARTNVAAALANSPPESSPPPALLKDPETRAMMQKQQAKAIARMADKVVSKDFIRDRNLTAEQAEQVKSLIREKAAAGQDLLTSMMFDGLDDAALAQRGRETKQRLEAADDALRGMVGADGLAALKEQERGLEDSQRLKRIREEMVAADLPLTESQQESLGAAMGLERQSFSFRVDYSDPSKVDFEHIRDHFSEENLQIYFEDMQELNARIAERAALFLSPGQIERFNTAQENHLEQARLTVKMTTELFNRGRRN